MTKDVLVPDLIGDVRYPQIKVKLVGNDGNAFAILGRMNSAMRNAGVSKEEIELFNEKAKSGDYNDLLRTCMEWVSVS